MDSCLASAYPIALVPSAVDIRFRAHLKATIHSDIKNVTTSGSLFQRVVYIAV